MRLLLLSFLFFIPLFSSPEGVILDLKEPTLSDGVLCTEKGGVIQGLDVRIQAKKLIYTKKEGICSLYAEEDLILEFGDYYFVGEALEYDFLTHEGILYNAKTSLEPWYFGGEQVLLHADGSITLYHGFVTTSESRDVDWEITAEKAHLIDKHLLSSKNVKFKIYSFTALWIPSFKADLDSIFDSPIRYDFKWGSRQGVRASMIYEIFSWQQFKVFSRLDYRVKRGFGGGIETYYENEKSREFDRLGFKVITSGF